MSNRFHSKYHRHNHHTDRIPDPRYPDSSHDPIASPDYPFLGDFVMFGGLSAVQDQLSAFAGSFVNTVPGGLGINIETNSNGLAIRAIGNVNVVGSLSANNLEFTGNVLRTYVDPITATGDFLIVRIKDINTGEILDRSIRLWSTITGE